MYEETREEMNFRMDDNIIQRVLMEKEATRIIKENALLKGVHIKKIWNYSYQHRDVEGFCGEYDDDSGFCKSIDVEFPFTRTEHTRYYMAWNKNCYTVK